MDIVFYIYLACVLFFTICLIMGVYVERKFDESHPIKKWWRKHIVGFDPEQKRPDDDFYV